MVSRLTPSDEVISFSLALSALHLVPRKHIGAGAALISDHASQQG